MTLSQSWMPQAVLRPTRVARGIGISHAIKRAVDILLLAVAAPIAVPILGVAVTALLIQGKPPIYRHQRIGRGGKAFQCLKLRTMDNWSEARFRRFLDSNSSAAIEYGQTSKLSHDPRVGRLGRFFRRTSIDELPQLLNVAKGEMSLVGPRPITRRELFTYGVQERRAYLTVAPGITGLWQVCGRNRLSIAQRAGLDAAYVAHRSLILDLGILLRTIPVVLRQTGL